ncbi:MAG TPA: hypothetical protein PLI62_09985 [Spirochaetota bacterium]|nr:hypothetical protein [Spirochaetota bacterium]
MRPPVCRICGKDLSEDEGGLVYFKKRPADIEWDEKMKQKDMIGHPPYGDWFCGNHIDRARELKDKPIDEAVRIMRMHEKEGKINS